MEDFRHDHLSADETRACNHHDLHVPAVLERADGRTRIYQQERTEDASRWYPGIVRTAYHGLGSHRCGTGYRNVPYFARIRIHEQIHSGELHCGCS